MLHGREFLPASSAGQRVLCSEAGTVGSPENRIRIARRPEEKHLPETPRIEKWAQ